MAVPMSPRSVAAYRRTRNISASSGSGCSPSAASTTQPVIHSRTAVSDTGRNYNDEVIVVRFLALAALVVWLGAMVVDLWFGVVAVDTLRAIRLLAYASGVLILACLFVMKFVGPPPPAFVPRAAIVAAMLLVAAWPAFAPV